MDETTRLILTSAASAGGGAALKTFADWFFSRGDRKADRAAAQAKLVADQAAANDKLAAELRDEQRKDNVALRERMATLEGQVIELNKTNESLRKENLALTEQNGKQAYQLALQAGQLAAQAAEIASMQSTLAGLRDHNAALESALRTAKIDVPDLRRRTGDTGPLAEPAM